MSSARRLFTRAPSTRPGFTIVELLVVVGIIAVLVAIMLPIVTRVRGSAINQVCKNNLRQIGNGILAYVNNNRGRFADPYTLGGASCRRLVGEVDEGGKPETYGWPALLDGLGYLSADRATGGVWVCPAQKDRFLEYKNTYLAWTMPRGLGQDKLRARYQLVWENWGELAYPSGVPAEVRINPRDDYIHPAMAGAAYEATRFRGPHWYRRAINGHRSPSPSPASPTAPPPSPAASATPSWPT